MMVVHVLGRNIDLISQRNRGSNVPINPFVPNAPFIYPQKTSENLTVFWCFQGSRERVHWERMGKVGMIYLLDKVLSRFVSSMSSRNFDQLKQCLPKLNIVSSTTLTLQDQPQEYILSYFYRTFRVSLFSRI